MSYPQRRKRIIQGRDGKTRIATFELSPANTSGFVRVRLDGVFAGTIPVESARMNFGYKERNPQ